MKSRKELFGWLAANYGKRCTAALTSSDVYALEASVAMCSLISYESAPRELFQAYGAIVRAMQQHTRWMAYALIACELDWGHRNMIWTAAELNEGDKPARLASFEPGGSREDLRKLTA
jgi:hypothetical protein